MLFVLSGIFFWLLNFYLDFGSNIPWGKRAGGKTVIQQPPAPPTPDPAEQATKIQSAKNTLDPQSAQTSYNILANPDYGLQPTTALFEAVRRSVFPQETAARDQLTANLFQNLQSPTGISQSQQTGINARREEAQTNLQKALRERANLGGNLYGGRAFEEEGRAVGDLQNAFAEEDIAREERARLNAIQAMIPFLQVLYPDVNITSPQFQSPVQSPDTYANALLGQRGQDMNWYNQQAASQAAQQSALYQALGNAAGGAFGGLGTYYGMKAIK